jgi:chaperone modulatory protein CbpM
MRLDESRVVAEIRRVTLRELRLWVREGWVKPAHGEAGPIFDEVDIARIRLLCDLRKDMALSTDALPVVLTLIDRLHETRRDLHLLAKAVSELPDETRKSVAASLRTQTGD